MKYLTALSKPIHFIFTHKKRILWTLAGLAFLFGVIGYVQSPKINGFEVINRSIGLFTFAWVDDGNGWLAAGEFLATLSVFFGVLVLFLSDRVNDWIVANVQKTPYTLLVGLGWQNSNFAQNTPDAASSTIIIENNPKNSELELFKQKGFGIVFEDAQDAVTSLNHQNLRNAIISTGDDRKNITIALELMRHLTDNTRQKIYARVENPVLNTLFTQNVIRLQNSVDIISYSLYENIAKALFEEHSILGYQTQLIQSDEAYNIILAGDGELCMELLYTLCILSSLPNQNHLAIHLLHPEAAHFYEKIKKRYSGIGNLTHITVRPLSLASDTAAFYLHEVWQSPNLTNIIIATDDEEKNLDIAISLQQNTYLKAISQKAFKTKVLFAIYTQKGLAAQIDNDKESFANFFTFADIAKASTPQVIIDEKLDLIAKSIHYFYKEMHYNPDLLITETMREKIEKRWLDLQYYSDKISSKMQSLHLNTKLMALGLQKVKSNKSPHELLKINKKRFTEKLGKLPFDEKALQAYSKKFAQHYDENSASIPTHTLPPFYKPENFNTLFDKLIRSEHERWNTYHYLNGWKYAPEKNKTAKEHNCLLPFEEMEDTVIFDIYAVLYIPNLLASAGYALKEI